VVTGVGVISAMGLSLDETWAGILAGRAAIGPLTQIEPELHADKTGGEAPPLPADFHADLPREVRYLRLALDQALAAAHAAPLPYAGERCGLVIGTTLHGIRAAGRYFRSLDSAELHTFLAPQALRLATRGLGFHGAAYTTCAACSSGLSSIALASSLLRAGALDLVIAGGYDVVSEYAYAGFNSLRLIADGPPRPFTKGRQGMKVSEGYGLMVLERSDAAARRGAPVFAYVRGLGESSDSHHLTQPHPQGEGAAAAMRAALTDAGLTADGVDLVAAHATGTPDNDAGEAAAMRAAFGERFSLIPVTALKSHLGHALGGAGAIEFILAAHAMRTGTLPPTANVSRELIEFADLNLLLSPTPARPLNVMTNSLGFGGANTCAIASSVAPHPKPRHVPQAVCITGVGVVLPGVIGSAALVARLKGGDRALDFRNAVVSDDEIMHLLNARRVRRLSRYVKLTLAATALAMQHARVESGDAWCRSASAILGTTHASPSYLEDFYGQVVREGLASANPLLFAEGVPNAGAAHVSLAFGLRGLCQSIIGSRTAGLDALRLAFVRIASGQWARAIVSAAEEHSHSVESAYRSCGLVRGDPSENRSGDHVHPFDASQGFTTGDAAVTFVLESAESAAARGVSPLATIRCADAVSYEGGEPSEAIESLAGLIGRLPAVPYIVSSANGTRISTLESAAIARAARRRATLTTLHGHAHESFAATPLLALAALVTTGRLPRAIGVRPGEMPADASPATGEEPVDSALVLASEYAGQTAGVVIDFAIRAGAKSNDCA
jgi:3-oxoacyl-[acyl-carrier-protein] synthase II